MSEPARIRPATLDDVPSIVAMQRAIHADHLVWDAARWTVDAPMDDVYRAWIAELIAHPAGGLVLVAEATDQIDPATTAIDETGSTIDTSVGPGRFSGPVVPLDATEPTRPMDAAFRSLIVGYALAEAQGESSRDWSPRCVYVHDLYVRPEHRRLGLARSLMDALLAWSAHEHPTLPLRLLTAAPNDAARAFFAKHGFRPAAVEMIREAPAASAASPAISLRRAAPFRS